MLRLLGGPVDELKEKARKASPITYVSAEDPPFLIVHGEKDNRSPSTSPSCSRTHLKKAGVEATFVRVKNGGHGFGPESDPNPEAIRERVVPFFDKHLSPNRAAGGSRSGKSD